MTKKTWIRAGVLLLLFAVVVLFAPRISCKHRQTNPVGYFERGPYMHEARYDHTATLLDDGNVLIAGGAMPGKMGYSKTAELYLTKKNKFILIPGLNIPRLHNAAVKTKNGKVLFFGGMIDKQPLTTDTVEEYDPSTRKFTIAGKMLDRRWNCQATLLDDGRVFIYGGAEFNSEGQWHCELYNPQTNSSAYTSKMHYRGFRNMLEKLADGKIFMIMGTSLTPEQEEKFIAKQNRGAVEAEAKSQLLGAVEIYDPKCDTFELKFVLPKYCCGPSVELSKSEMLIGILKNPVPSRRTNLWAIAKIDLTTGMTTIIGDLNIRANLSDVKQDCMLIKSRFALVTGINESNDKSFLEAIDIKENRIIQVGEMIALRSGYTTTILPDNNVLIAGGYHVKNNNYRKTRRTEIFKIYQ